MAEPLRDLDTIESAVRRFRDERDWARFHTPKDLAVSISIEAAELLEHFQWKTPAEVETALADPTKRRAVEDELADVLLLLVSAADRIGVDLHAVALRKLAENALKYPVEKSRGRADKYDQL